MWLKRDYYEIRPLYQRGSGTMSPTQHGEVFVTQDGAETDLDLGSLRAFYPYQNDKTQQLPQVKFILKYYAKSVVVII